MKTYIVQLEDHDDVISTRDKISWSKAGRVLLVWPRKGRVLERRVDLLILQRQARQQGAQLGIVTRSGEVKTNAKELGIPVFRDPAQAQQANWTRLRHKPKPGWQDRPYTDPHRLREQREALNQPPAENRWLRWVMFPVGVLAFLILVLFFAPGAVIDLSPVRQPQALSMAVWASPAIRFPNPSGGLPAQAISVVVEGRDQAPSTGRDRLPDRAAAGEVLLTNLTDQVVDVPEGTVVLTAANPAIRFSLTQAAQIPAGVGKTAKAPVRAERGGTEGNLPGSRIRAMEGPLGLRLTVDNPSPTSGGSDRATAVPSETDYAALKAKLLESLQARALEEIQLKVKPGQRLLEGTLRPRAVVEETREPAKAQPGDQLQLTLRVEFEAWTMSEVDLQAVVTAGLEANRPQGLQPVPGSLNVEFVSQPALDAAAVEAAKAVALSAPLTSPEADASNATPTASALGSSTAAAGSTAAPAAAAHWQVRATRMLEAELPEAAIVQWVRGRGLSEAQAMLQSGLALSAMPRIRMFPAWWVRLPYLPFRIQVVKQ